ncbi:hypothetical protein VCHC47A1_1434, partial [Vibrio cholerae HC-47A1]|jgi:hypothetical protein
MAGN